MAQDVKKVLASAIANAENNHNLDVDSLVVAEASVGKSLSMKRCHATRPRPFEPDRQTVQPCAHHRARAAGSLSMGQKSSPIGLRLQINRTWDSRWFAEGDDYGRLLLEDLKIRKFIMEALPQAAISKVVIERPAKLCRVSIYAARPGVIIGKKGADIEKLRKQLGAMTSSDVSLNIVEIRKPEIDSRLVAQGVADQLERRVAFRRAMKRAVQSALRLGAEGIRITCSGRLGGAEIARTEWYREGRVPLHTLRANVDYAEATAHTAYGVCGVKVWIFKGEILGHDPLSQDRLMMEAQTSGVRPAADRKSEDAATQTHQVPQGPQGPHPWRRQGRHRVELRRLRPQGDGAGADHRAPDRGRAPRDHAPHQAPGAVVDPHLPGCAGLVEARRGPHGLGQGLARILGVPRQARPHPVRARRRSRPVAKVAFERAAEKLPIKTKVVARLGESLLEDA